MRTRRFGFFLLVIALAALLVAGCARQAAEEPREENKEPYVIGAVLSLTGAYTSLGVPERDVLELETKKINDAGGVNGYPISLFIEDDATLEANAVAAVTKLIEQRKVIAVIGATGTGQTMAMRSAIVKAEIPQVSLAGGSVITQPEKNLSPWVFQVPWPNSVVVPFVFDYLKSKDIDEIGVISDSGGFGKDGKAVIENLAAGAGIKIVANEVYNIGDLDMKPQLTKIKGTDAKAVVVWGAAGEPAIIAKNMKELGMTMPLVGSHGIARKAFITGAGDAANGVVFAAGKVIVPEAYGENTDARAVADDFIKRYKDRYGSEPDGTFPGHAYDGFHIVINALRELGKAPGDFEPSELRAQIEKTSDLVLLGGTFNYSLTDHVGTKKSDLVMVEIEDGKWVVLK